MRDIRVLASSLRRSLAAAASPHASSPPLPAAAQAAAANITLSLRQAPPHTPTQGSPSHHQSNAAKAAAAVIGGSLLLGYGAFSSSKRPHYGVAHCAESAGGSGAAGGGASISVPGGGVDVDKFLKEDDLIAADVSLQDSDVTIYQFESCPFCRKVRIALDYHNIPYNVVEVHPLAKKEISSWSPDYKKVPILVIRPNTPPSASSPVPPSSPDDPSAIVLKDSKRIVHNLVAHEARRRESKGGLRGGGGGGSGKAGQKESEAAKEEEKKWIKWSDDVLVQLIVMNIYRSLKESAETFDYLLTHPSFSFFEKWGAHLSGTLVMWLVSKSRKKKYKVDNEREALYGALNEFVEAVGRRTFLGGETPNEADFNIFGILKSIEGFRCEQDVFQNSKIGPWYQSMQRVVGGTRARNIIARGTKEKQQAAQTATAAAA